MTFLGQDPLLQIVVAGKHRKRVIVYCYHRSGIRIMRVHGGWTYQLILRTHMMTDAMTRLIKMIIKWIPATVKVRVA